MFIEQHVTAVVLCLELLVNAPPSRKHIVQSLLSLFSSLLTTTKTRHTTHNTYIKLAFAIYYNDSPSTFPFKTLYYNPKCACMPRIHRILSRPFPSTVFVEPPLRKKDLYLRLVYQIVELSFHHTGRDISQGLHLPLTHAHERTLA